MPYPATDLYPDPSLYPEGVVVTTQSPYTGRLGHPAAQFAAIKLASTSTAVVVIPPGGDASDIDLPTVLILSPYVTSLELAEVDTDLELDG